ncbi:MAG: type II secretion system protein [Planctomycetaceae bacterium]|nr:type II secretion system protein [Planctomycetaceae bacterium]MCP4477162.1 type II secretion system protein [Planctomycetaceae bacterium]MCP4778602.1 type II secretion system protein [Planctomycetaceae bacterium]
MKHKPRKRIIPRDVGRCGFTLIELLLVIAIVTVLSTMALGVMRQAQTDAKISATEARLTQVNAIMEVVMEDYSVRRMPVDLNAVLTPPVTRQMLREARYQVLSELIDVELPRPLYNPNTESYVPNSNRVVSPFLPGPGYVGSGNPTIDSDPIGFYRDDSFLGNSNAPYSAIMQRWQLLAQQYPNDLNLPGEYLYQFLYSYDFDGAPAVEALGAQAIADTDGDQLMEVVDAFGEPLLYEIQQRAPETQDTDQDGDNDVTDPNDDGDAVPDLEDSDDDGDGIPDARDENGTYDPLLRDGVQVINNIRIIVFSSRDTQDFN